MSIKKYLNAFKYRPGRFYYITLTISIFTISFVSSTLVRVNLKEQEYIMKNSLHMRTMQFLADMYMYHLDQPEFRDYRVEGLTVYSSDGATIYSYGKITEDPRLSSIDHFDSLSYDGNQNLIFINFELNGLLDDIPNHTHKVFGNNYEYNHIIHLEIKDKRFFKKRNFLRIIQYGIYLISIVIYAQMMITFKKINNFKTELDSQKNLVILGSALRTITHEMKNPLAAIRLQSGYIRKVYPDDFEQETSIIDNEVERLSRLMEFVRNFLKEPIGEPEIFDVAKYLEEMANLFPEQLHWIFPQKPLYISFSKDKFRSVIENLINNAIESNSPQNQISIECYSSRRFIYIHIKDRGIGIPHEIQDKLFDPFFTTKSGGSGVGLMIVKRFVEAVGGQLSIESVPGEKTDVEVRLPIKQGAKA